MMRVFKIFLFQVPFARYVARNNILNVKRYGALCSPLSRSGKGEWEVCFFSSETFKQERILGLKY